ncbi:MAG TPA: radical SAM protein [Polyangiaceae bacterium]|jgi:radical SAM protein with 4Fe4S-binding SPASM domain|nr:radical SAM protein [Polyangiaceae bacterium]
MVESLRLPVVPSAAPGSRRLPLAGASRPRDREARPIVAVWELTLRCDLACSHCSSRAGRARPDELSTAEALDLVRQMAELGVLEVTLIGGEAYLRDDWATIVRAIRQSGMECTMVTGGRGMTAERARAAKAAGLMSVSVSVDGLVATHDALRGLAGSHRAALEAMAHLARAGVQVSANTQIGRRNRRELPDLFELLAAAGAHSWQLQLTVASGRVADDPTLLLEPYHLIEVMPAIARIHRRARAVDVRIFPGNNLGYYGPFESLLRSEFPGQRKGSCPAGRSVLGIESNGAIKGCPSLPSDAYVGGNVRHHQLRDIWERAEPLRFTRDRTVTELWGHCKDCYYADDCLGGCSWTAHSLLGRRGNNPYCHHRALELLQQGRRERVLRVEAPPGLPFDYGKFDIIEEDWPAAELETARAVAAGNESWLLEGNGGIMTIAGRVLP